MHNYVGGNMYIRIKTSVMGEFGRILTNLGLAYGLMSKDQFVERIARYAHEQNMSEEKMMALVESLFEELEITHRRRQARQMFEAHEMKKSTENPESEDFFDHVKSAAHDFITPDPASEQILSELKNLRIAIEKLTSAMQEKPEGE